MSKISSLSSAIRLFFKRPYFGFIQGHFYLTTEEIEKISSLVAKREDDIVKKYEKSYASLVGEGEAVAYAAARMGFYDLMRLQGIGKGDEVILPGATCAVMVNAVLRAGATPIFADIDPDTFGSSSQAIAVCITPKTRMIVAQHSFGIPCDIESIVELANLRNIFLLEDCALTLGSTVNNVVVGNFGDAALFSTDHSKPLNTLTGGLIYTRNAELARRLRISQTDCPDLSTARQKALWRRFLLEAHYCVPGRYGRMVLIDIFASIRKRLTHSEGDFLADDFGASSVTNYPYPARLPAFLAAAGLIEVRRWAKVADERKITLMRLLDTLTECRSGVYLPAAYKNKALQIVPLRLAWSQPDGQNARSVLRHFIHVPWTWFMSPIIATKEPLENLGYYSGVCPVSERIGPNMVNIPCNLDRKEADLLISLIRKINL